MKCLDISSFYSEKGGGVKTYHLSKLHYFSQHPAHEYVLIVPAERRSTERVHGGRIYRVRGIPVGWKGAYRQIADLPEIRRIVAREEPDIIEAGSPYADGWMALVAGRRSGAKVAGFYHADVPDSYIAPAVEMLPRRIGDVLLGLSRRYMRFSYQKLDRTVVTSRHIEEKLNGYGIPNTDRVPLGVDTTLFTPAKRSDALRRHFGADRNDKVLLFVGRFRKEKGIDVLIEALRTVCRRPDVVAVLVGDGPHGARLRSELGRAQGVHILGYHSDPQRLAAIYASADLFLSPGPYETFGLAALEAMSAGLPVAGANRGGTRELVSASGTGGLFEAHDADDFVRCIDEILGSDLEEQRRRARNFVTSGYSWTHTFDKMIESYGRLLHGDSPAVISARIRAA